MHSAPPRLWPQVLMLLTLNMPRARFRTSCTTCVPKSVFGLAVSPPTSRNCRLAAVNRDQMSYHACQIGTKHIILVLLIHNNTK
jgi:hypothetical protein